MAYDVNFTFPNYKLNVESLWDYICYSNSNFSVGFVGYDMILWSWTVYVSGSSLRRNGKINELKYMLSHGNFPKHSECFGRIMEVKPSKVRGRHSHKPLTTFGMFRNVCVSQVAGKEAKYVFKLNIFSFRQIHPPTHTHTHKHGPTL